MKEVWKRNEGKSESGGEKEAKNEFMVHRY